jgi:hypothetical protein
MQGRSNCEFVTCERSAVTDVGPTHLTNTIDESGGGKRSKQISKV